MTSTRSTEDSQFSSVGDFSDTSMLRFALDSAVRVDDLSTSLASTLLDSLSAAGLDRDERHEILRSVIHKLRYRLRQGSDIKARV